MTLSILSSRDAGPNIAIAFSFNVSYGPPSRLWCTRNNFKSPPLYDSKYDDGLSSITREVIRSRYISSTLPDMTRVTFRPDPQPRQAATYGCTVTVESRKNIPDNNGYFDQIGGGSTTSVTLTGKWFMYNSKWIIPCFLSCKSSHWCYSQHGWFQQCFGLLVCSLISSTSWL